MDQKRRRLEELLGRARRHRRAGHWSCKGVPGEEIAERIHAAVDPADEDLIESVMAFVDEAHAETYRNETTGELYLDKDGQQQPGRHALDDWAWCLSQGWLDLPEKLPRVFWESFNLRHCSIYRRCESCRAGFGNAVLFSRCPLCGGRIWNRCLGKDDLWKPSHPMP